MCGLFAIDAIDFFIPAFAAIVHRVAIDCGFVIGPLRSIVDCVANVPDGLLGFSFDLLGATLDLLFSIAGPLANLTSYAARGVVDGSLSLICIHMSTSCGV